MSRMVILGAGISGRTAAAFVTKRLSRDHPVTVVSASDFYNGSRPASWLVANAGQAIWHARST
jgi:sulfide:quinone oxidoreductase